MNDDARLAGKAHHEDGLGAFLRRIFTRHDFDLLPGNLPVHVAPRSLEELPDALRPAIDGHTPYR